MEKYYIEQILAVIKECEEVQHSNESEYTKEQEKISAYQAIKDILNIRD